MRPTLTGRQSARLEVVRRRFELWRSRRQGRERIPERLWTAAVKLAAAQGLWPTARALRLDYYSLKKRVEAATPGGASVESMPTQKAPRKAPAAEASSRESGPTFIELPPLEPLGSSECFIELEHPRGAKMRIRLTGRQSPEVVSAVSRVFFGAGA